MRRKNKERGHPHQPPGYVSVLLVMLFLSPGLMAGCSQDSVSLGSRPQVKDIILATTTSTRDSGLLDELVPIFEEQSGYVLKTVAVGTGKALKMGEEGDADVLLVHAPSAEETFMQAGHGSERWLVMHNDFVIVGPANDPAEVNGIETAGEALSRIADLKAAFTSRGDDSGTHKKERGIWGAAGVTPSGGWYIETGQGMGQTLRIASEKGTYTLTDLATYIFNRDTLDLEILVQGDTNLLNVYHVMTVNADKWARVNKEGALAFANFIVSPEIQEFIAAYGMEEFGQPLFIPDAGRSAPELGLE